MTEHKSYTRACINFVLCVLRVLYVLLLSPQVMTEHKTDTGACINFVLCVLRVLYVL